MFFFSSSSSAAFRRLELHFHFSWHVASSTSGHQLKSSVSTRGIYTIGRISGAMQYIRRIVLSTIHRGSIVYQSCYHRVTFVLSTRHRISIVYLSCCYRVSIWYNNARFVLPPYLHRVSIGSDRVAIGSHRTSIVHPSALCADYSLRRGHREKLRTIFKIDLSCCHRV